jgi:nucleotide-binding universal stress UspA family protein
VFKHLLVTLDISPRSEAVIPYVMEAARTMNMAITLLHVVEVGRGEVGAIRVGEEASTAVAWAQAYLDGVAAQLDGIDVRTEIRQGQPAREILNAIRELDVDLVAMATHSRQGIDRLLFGSIAEEVIHASSMPVLLIRAS